MEIDRKDLSPAERLLWSYGVTEPSHIDLVAIAYDNGADVLYRPLGGCEARLVAGHDRAVISINSSGSAGRQRFSLGHELAHWICDRHSGSFLCAKEDIGPQNAEAKSVEAQANAYASQLILPTYLVDPWIKDRKTSLEVASSLAKEFNSSLTAAAIKMVNRSAMRACVACHTRTGMAWHKRSGSFPFDLYVIPELHYDTAAFQMAFDASAGSGMSRPIREPANRWLSGSGTYRMEVVTQSVRLPDSTVLTMIVL